MKYKCPCCGYYTLSEPLEDALAFICPVCFWEIDTFIENENEPSDQNRHLTLLEARENFIRFGACCEDVIKYVRKPTVDELNI